MRHPPHPSGRPRPPRRLGIVSRVQGQPQGFLNPRLEGPWHDTRAFGFTDPRRDYLIADEEQDKRR